MFKKENKNFKPNGNLRVEDLPDSGTPEKPSENRYTIELVDKPYKTLGDVKALTQYATPNQLASNAPVPYRTIARTNKVEFANYPGKMNYSGNITDVLPLSSKSTMNKCVDMALTELTFKYQYLPMTATDKNTAAATVVHQAFEEAISKVASESFTELPFFQQYYFSSIPNMASSDGSHACSALIWYQTMLQNIAAPITRYQLLLAMEDHLMMMGYNKEASVISELYGLFKKAAFVTKIKSFNNYIKGQYFDTAWFRQTNTIVNNVSRKSNSLREPLICINGVTDCPVFECWTSNPTSDPDASKIFDDVDYEVTFASTSSIPVPNPGQHKFEVAMNHLISMMGPYNIMSWVRNYVRGNETTFDSVTQYFNCVNYYIDQILKVLKRFPADTAEIKTMLDVAQRVNMNRWTQGVMIDIDTKAKYEVKFQTVINDIFRTLLATSYNIQWDDHTQRWVFSTVWDEYEGIPKYDQMNGGAFLTFSCHNITVPSGDDTDDTKYLLPILFTPDWLSFKAVALNREGKEFEIRSTTGAVTNNTTLARMELIEGTLSDMKVPYINTYNRNFTPKEKSHVLRFLEDLFGFGGLNPLVTAPTVADITDVTMKDSLVGVLDVQLEDVSNDMMTYYQAYAPLKVYSSTLERTMGFTDIPFFNK